MFPTTVVPRISGLAVLVGAACPRARLEPGTSSAPRASTPATPSRSFRAYPGAARWRSRFVRIASSSGRFAIPHHTDIPQPSGKIGARAFLAGSLQRAHTPLAGLTVRLHAGAGRPAGLSHARVVEILRL